MSSDDVRRELAAEMVARGWSKAALSREANVDPGTIGDFLNGKTQRLHSTTALRLERAVEWAPGRVDELMELPGGPATTVLLSDDRHLVALPHGWDEGLSPVQRAARLARAEAAFFEQLG